MNYKWIPLVLGLTLSLGLTAQDAGDGQGRGHRGMNSERGGRGGMNRMRGSMIDRMLQAMRDDRYEAEQKIREKFASEYDVLAKERSAWEEKMQKLARKAEVTLPDTKETVSAKFAEFQKKYAKEIQTVKEQAKTDFRAAMEGMEKLRALLEKEGIKLPIGPGMGGRGGMRGEGRPGMAPPEGGSRRNSMGELRKTLKDKYPAEYTEIEKLQKKNPAEARKKLQDLVRKYRQETSKK